MKNKALPLIISLVLPFVIGSCQPSTPPAETSADQQSKQTEQTEQTTIEVVDFAENIIRLERPAEKIVALAPHIVENVFSANAGDKLVGVIEYSDYPPQAKQIASVGSFEKINLERILELKPDLIISWDSGNSHTAVEKLRQLGFTIYLDRPDSLFDIAKSVKDIGVLTGNAESSNKKAQDFIEQLNHIKKTYENAEKVRSFYQVWNSPLQTISGNHIISHSIEVCGGTNIYRDEFAVAPVINIESVLEQDPEVIIASGFSDQRPQWLDDWRKWPALQAVKNGNLFHVNPNHIQRHSFRILLGIQTVCAQLEQARKKGLPSPPR